MPLFPLLLFFAGGYLLARHAVVQVGAVPVMQRALPAPRGALDRGRPQVIEMNRHPVREDVYVPMQPACPPSPIAVMSELLENGRPVPPFVVQCAIAEAELAGQYELAYALTQQYVIPQLQAGGGDAAPAQALAAIPGPAVVAPSADVPDMSDDAALEAEAHGIAPPQAQAPQAMSSDFGPPPEVTSPISGVQDQAWSEMLARLVREPPVFDNTKHTGRYRHHKARLSEVGFDPSIMRGDPKLQDLAMSTDLTDCFRHLHASGTLDHAVGRAITVPGQQGAVPATLSGVLGVCSVAGLERAVSWMENEADRAAYPHTTMAFIRCNGVF